MLYNIQLVVIKILEKKLYINIDNKLILFKKLPCMKCKYRYSLHCPSCNWNLDGKYNTYDGFIIDARRKR